MVPKGEMRARDAPSPKARDMKARGKREARRPGTNKHDAMRPERPKYLLRPFRAASPFYFCIPGATCSLRFALAPGFYIPRLRRWSWPEFAQNGKEDFLVRHVLDTLQV